MIFAFTIKVYDDSKDKDIEEVGFVEGDSFLAATEKLMEYYGDTETGGFTLDLAGPDKVLTFFKHKDLFNEVRDMIENEAIW